MTPDKIGRYQVLSELGRGGMATVYRARDPIAEREVAIKVLPPEMLHDPQFKVRFEREAKLIARLEHPAIVPVYDFGEDSGMPYFVMRLMTGGSLSDRLKNGPLSVPDAYRLLARLSPALDSAHSKGIIHRDLKPGNILFDEYGEPYISDFGIAKITESQSSMTGSGIVGTPAYMSPEQAQGGTVDNRSDIYGLGVILFEALSGQQPYSGDTPMSVVVKHITDPVPHILDVKPDLPLGVDKVIGKALAKDKDERFPTCQTLADALGSISRGETLVIGPTPTESHMAPPTAKVPRQSAEDKTVHAGRVSLPPGKEPRKRSFAWVGILVGVFLVCLLAGGALFLFRSRIPFLAALFNEQQLTPSATATFQPTPEVPTSTVEMPPITVVATDTFTPTERPTLTSAPLLPAVGGSDLIAFLKDNNIWLMEMDGSNLVQLTTDGTVKRSLQWSPDGESILYITGKCINILEIETASSRDLACFLSAAYLEDLSISTDGTQVAISLDRILYVVPYDIPALDAARDHNSLKSMSGCFTYQEAGAKAARWSSDGNKIALELISPAPGGRPARWTAPNVWSASTPNTSTATKVMAAPYNPT